MKVLTYQVHERSAMHKPCIRIKTEAVFLLFFYDQIHKLISLIPHAYPSLEKKNTISHFGIQYYDQESLCTSIICKIPTKHEEKKHMNTTLRVKRKKSQILSYRAPHFDWWSTYALRMRFNFIHSLVPLVGRKH